MEQIEGEERVEDAAAVKEHVEATEQVELEERAEAAAADELTEAMEQVEGEERPEMEATAPAEEEAEAAAAEESTKEMDQVEVEEQAKVHAEVEEALRSALPLGRVKKIIRVDRDIRKVSAEASLLIAAATELFLGSLAAGAHTAAAQRGRRAVRAAHVRAAARAHHPTADFLLDCLPPAEEAPRARSGSDGGGAAAAAASEPKPLPRGTRRIDAFFQKVT